MRILSKEDIDSVLSEIKKGAVFIYPTDTIYGVGCIATLDSSVQRIRELKNRDAKPFSVIAPSIGWIRENCVVSELAEKWLFKLPGPFTFILPMSGQPVSSFVSRQTLGVRIPAHWISEVVAKLGVPIVTTSVNISGQSPAANLDDLKKFNVDFILYEGEKLGRPSTVVDLSSGEVVRR